MSDKLYGQCAICGGSLTADHKCWPIPPPTDKEWANESLRIALQNIQDAATKPLHIEIESLRSRLAEAERLIETAVGANAMWKRLHDEGQARLAEAERLLFALRDGIAVADFGDWNLLDQVDSFRSGDSTASSASAVQPERCCLDYPRCDCNSPPEPDDVVTK